MKAFYCLIICLSIHLYGYAILPTQFHFRHYNIENGVSSNCITSIIQDQKGYIWMGTENGLSRFDGTQFSFYRKQIPLTLTSILASSILFVKQMQVNSG